MKMTRRTTRRLGRGFTLVELLVTVALVAVLMAGIASVFGIAARTVDIASSVSDNTRQIRAAQTVMESDLAGYADDGVLIIHGLRMAALPNAEVALTDRDYPAVAAGGFADRDAALRSFDRDGLPGDEPTPLFELGQRNFRLDRLIFFGRGDYTGQTGNPGTLISDISSNEAAFLYGHLRQPSNEGLTQMAGGNMAAFTSVNNPVPGHGLYDAALTADDEATPSENNFYADQWALGRTTLLLKEPTANTADVDLDGTLGSGEGGSVIMLDEPVDDVPTAARFFGRNNDLAIFGSYSNTIGINLTPLTFGSPSTVASAINGSYTSEGTPFPIQSSRYDVAGVSIAGYNQQLERFTRLNGGGVGSAVWPHFVMNYRAQGTARATRPLSPRSLARTVPVLLEQCNSFAVEFAGDFVTQNTNPFDTGYGIVTGVGPDGTTDFVVLNPGSPQQRAMTRFYGMPRDIGGYAGGTFIPEPDGFIPGNSAPNQADNASNDLVDVVPLRDVIYSAATGLSNAQVAALVPTFERIARFNDASFDLTTGGMTEGVAPFVSLRPAAEYNVSPTGDDILPRQQYLAAWGPDTTDEPRPQLLRIVVGIGSAESAGETYEFVVDLRR